VRNAIYPNLFLSIGAMKAGTTWLYAVLGRHPSLHVTMEKEIHYFHHRFVDSSELSEANRLKKAKSRYLQRFDPERANIDAVRENLHWISNYLSRPVDDYWYRNLFALRDHQSFACDFSNLNAHLPAEAWTHIRARCPKLRVLFTMRDPAARLWSHVKFHLQLTGKLACLDTWGPAELEDFARQPHIWQNGEYGQCLRRLQASLPPGEMLVLFYEDTHAEQRQTLARIERFLGIPPFDYPQALLNRRLTEGLVRPMPEYFLSLFAEDFIRIAGEVEDAGFTPPGCWQRPHGSGTPRRRAAPPRPPAECP
jgi:hypothetical protein